MFKIADTTKYRRSDQNISDNPGMVRVKVDMDVRNLQKFKRLISPSINPISPDYVTECVNKTIPNEVITIVNEQIISNWDGYKALVKQDTVARLLCEALNENTRFIYDNHCLDFENIFRKNGWSVIYNKPAYNEEARPYWEFRKK